MLKIKLARFGKRKQPHYRIVINEARDKRDGQYVVAIGIYAPTQVPKILQVDMEAYKSWITRGAQPTETVAALIARLETGNPFPPKKPQLSKKAKAKAAAAKEAAANPAPEAPAAETPAPEVVAEPAAEATPEVAPAEPAAETTPAAEAPAA